MGQPRQPRFTDRVRAAEAAGLPVPLIRGGDGTTELPALPDTFDGIADAELAQLESQLQAWFDTARDSAPIDELRACQASIDRLRVEAESRISAAGERDAVVAELSATLEPPAAPTTDPAPVPAPVADPPAPGDPAPVVAAAPPALPPLAPAGEIVELAPIRMGRSARRERASQPDPVRVPTTIVAAGGIPDVSANTELDMRGLARSITRRWESFGITHGGHAFQPMGSPEKVLVASVRSNLPEERHLREGRDVENRQKINDVISPQAITAAGGLCAPVQPYYDIMTLAVADRPVRDASASFTADASRGGIRFVPPPKLSDVAASVGFITAATDAAALGGTPTQIAAATKPVVHVTCPSAIEADLAAITRILEFGNFGARAYPEQVEAWVTLSIAQWARRAEQALLDQYAANSTQITVTGIVGAARALIAQMIRASAYYRNHNRMAADSPLRVMMPAWVIDMMVCDITLGSGYEVEFLAMARQEIVDALGELAINVTFYLDTGTGKGQLFNSGNAQSAGAALTFPSTAVWYMFAEGSFLFLDGGELNFNIWRDSQTNALNNYRMGAESFEQLAFVGVESLECTSTIVANGTAAGPAYGSSTVSSPIAIPTSF